LLQTALAKKKISAVCLIIGFVVLICIAVLGGGLSATPLVAKKF
jgi:hypothetical protein